MEVLNHHKSGNCHSVEDFFSESMGCSEHHCHHHHHEHHENHVHEIAEESVDAPNDKKGFVCEFDGCNKVFPSKWKLYQHHRVHTGERPFVCEICNKAFKIKDALNRHRHTHSKDKPYKCTFPGCTKSFSTSHNLKYHLATHSDKKPFVCDYPGCGKSFHTKSQLNQHMRTKTVHQKIDLERRQSAAPLISMESANNINSGKSVVVPAMTRKSRSSTMAPSSSASSPRRAIKGTTQEDTKSSQASIVKHISKETQRQAQKIRELEGYIKMMQQALSVNNISFPSTTSSSPSVTSGDEGITVNDAKFSMVENMSTDNSDHEAAALSTPSTSTDRDDCYSVNFDDGPELFSLGPDHSCSSSSCCDQTSLFDSITPLEVNDNAAQFDSAFDFMPEDESF